MTAVLTRADTKIQTKADSRIRADDAEVDRKIRQRAAQLELDDQKRRNAEAAKDREDERKARNAQVKRTTREATRRAKQQAAREWRKAFGERFLATLSGRLVLLLVVSAVATAWHGQYGYLHAPAIEGGQGLNLLFSVAGATALELLGLAMGAVVRSAGEYRDRALRARLVMWAVIGFSAWSNWTHNGPVLAALSVLGPTAWEIHEWWQRRERLHVAGLLAPRPVRPRFPLDQVALFPAWTFAAYRIAVRDGITDHTAALAVAATERADRAARKASRRAMKRWAPGLRTLIADQRQTTENAGSVAFGRLTTETTEGDRPAAAETTDATGRDDRTTPRRSLRLFGRRPAQTAETTEPARSVATEAAAGRLTTETTEGDRPAAAETTDATGRDDRTTPRRSLRLFGRRPAQTAETTEPARSVATEAAAGRLTTETTEGDRASTTGATEAVSVATDLRRKATEAQPAETAEATEGGRPAATGPGGPVATRTTETTGRQAAETTDAAGSVATESQATEATETTEGGRPAATDATDAADRRDRTRSFGRDRDDRDDRLRLATETTEDVDVSDLLPAARRVAAGLPRLSRDALLAGLRSEGHSVGGRRRDAIYRAVQAAKADGSTTDQAAA